MVSLSSVKLRWFWGGRVRAGWNSELDLASRDQAPFRCQLRLLEVEADMNLTCSRTEKSPLPPSLRPRRSKSQLMPQLPLAQCPSSMLLKVRLIRISLKMKAKSHPPAEPQANQSHIAVLLFQPLS